MAFFSNLLGERMDEVQDRIDVEEPLRIPPGHEDGNTQIYKVLSTPDDPSVG